MPSIRATTDRVIVVPSQPEEVTSGGLYLPEVARETQTQGTVISVGPGVEDLSEGDEIIYTAHAGASIKHEGVEHFSLFKGEIIAVISA